MSKKTLQKILDTLYHSYNGADGDDFATSDAKAAIQELFMEVIGEDECASNPQGQRISDPYARNELRAELRKAVEAL